MQQKPPKREDEGRELFTASGSCVGHRLLGKKCMFIDLRISEKDLLTEKDDHHTGGLCSTSLPEENKAEATPSTEERCPVKDSCTTSCSSSTATCAAGVVATPCLTTTSVLPLSAAAATAAPPPKAKEATIHLVGDHVPRAKALRVTPVSKDEQVYSLFIASSPEVSLSPEEFVKFTTQLGSPGEFTKPYIGDTIKFTGFFTGTASVQGHTVKRVNAVRLEIVSRGEIPRPGDYATKWFGGQASKPPAQGTPRRHGNRFSVFASFCAETFSLAPPSPRREEKETEEEEDTKKGKMVLDIAGANGKLSAAFNKLNVQTTIVDPRAVDSQQRRRGEKAKRSEALCSTPYIEDFFSADLHKTAIEQCNLIVGLHCDGAVNEIVRSACLYQKNFAMVICCVFPKTYERVLNNGKKVITREELNQWVIEECERSGYKGKLELTTLPFDGANVCVFGKVC